MNAKVFLFAMMFATPAVPQGFADMGQSAQGFAMPAPRAFLFPEDHAPHPDFRIEWWYLTANLSGPDGTDYGAQWTLFRTALSPGEADGWASPQLWMGHAAATTPDRHLSAERLARGGIGQAGVVLDPFTAWIDAWQMKSHAIAGADPLSALSVKAGGSDFSYDLSLRAEGPIVPQGMAGYSQKSESGQASMYYSQPFYRVSGTLTLDGTTIPVTGQGWLDREWSSQPLATDQTGWDWFSLGFDDGTRLMAFRLRDGGAGFASATFIAADGSPTPLPSGAITLTPVSTSRVEGRDIPTAWRVELPEKGIDVQVKAVNPQAWMATSVPYWEGPVRITGSHAGKGYLEMTGYK